MRDLLAGTLVIHSPHLSYQTLWLVSMSARGIRQQYLEQLVQWLVQVEKGFRGTEAQLTQFARAHGQNEADIMRATTCIDVGPYVQQKIAAIAAHRSQYALEADILPLPILQELMGREYFIRAHPAPKLETELLPSLAAAPDLHLT